MNKLQAVKMKQNIRKMKESSSQCVQFLAVLQDRILALDDPKLSESLSNVVQHEKNMVKFFGILEQQL